MHSTSLAYCAHCNRCSDGKAKAKAEEVALGSLDVEPKDISIGYHALSILAGLGRRASSEALDNALAPLQKLKASKGRMRASSKAAPSLTATALGYLTAAAAEKCGGIGSQHLPVVETLLNGIPLVSTSCLLMSSTSPLAPMSFLAWAFLYLLRDNVASHFEEPS